jgi:DNA invertase Pin-like site-specific DNA recombinase
MAIVSYSRDLEPAADSTEVLTRTIERLKTGDVLAVPKITDLCDRVRDLAQVLGLIKDRGALVAVQFSSKREGESALTAWRRDIRRAGHALWWRRHQQKYGLPIRRPGQPLKGDGVGMVHRLRDQGNSVPAIAKTLKLSEMTVYRYLNRTPDSVMSRKSNSSTQRDSR